MTKHKKILLVILGIILFFHLNKNTPKNFPVDKPQDIVVVEPKKELSTDDVVSSIDELYIRFIVKTLSSKEFCGRATGTKGNLLASQFICSELDSMSVPYKIQSFKARGRETHNIIANINSKSKSNSTIVIGAHFDHLGGDEHSFFPGADDNASGVAGVLTLARSLSKYNNFKHNISIHFYSAEELGLIGSSYYCKNPLFPENNPDINSHIAMINMDMIGYLKNKYSSSENCTEWRTYKEWRVLDKYTSSSINLREVVDKLSSKYSFAKNISGYRPGGSDHAPFFNSGVPVIFLHTGSHPHYHKTTDTPEKLNYSGMVDIVKLAAEIVFNIDK